MQMLVVVYVIFHCFVYNFGFGKKRKLLLVFPNNSQSSRDGVRWKRSAREYSVKRFEQSPGLDTSLYNSPTTQCFIPRQRFHRKCVAFNQCYLVEDIVCRIVFLLTIYCLEYIGSVNLYSVLIIITSLDERC